MDLQKEEILWEKGFKRVAGIDEAGRGPIAGPVFACALIVLKKVEDDLLRLVKDSKKLSPKKREEVYRLLIKNKNIVFGVSSVSPKIIDRINILEATKLAMKKAAEKINPDYLIIDGNSRIKTKVVQETVIKGDNLIFSCAAASIIAKVRRDRLMIGYSEKYPGYGLEVHKGYPSTYHLEALKRLGPLPIHRSSFAPLCERSGQGDY